MKRMLNRLLAVRDDYFLNVIVVFVFILVFGFYSVRLWERAALVDNQMNGLVRVADDSWEYQQLAVNLLYGQGFSNKYSLAPEIYNLDFSTVAGRVQLEQIQQNGLEEPQNRFYRSPGWPMMMSLTYQVFGNETRYVRYLQVVLVSLTAVCLLLTGSCMLGWMGALAGGMSGLLYIIFAPSLMSTMFQRMLTEIPAAFLLTLFCLVFVLYTRQHHLRWLALAGAILAMLILTRLHFLTVVPFLLLYLLLQHTRLKHLTVFCLVLGLPLAGWSAFASLDQQKLVLLSVQGNSDFPRFNNIDVLEGVGPERLGQGRWSPGKVYDEEGRVIGCRHCIEPHENGYLIGLRFWWNNFDELPRLFYVKLREGFWYNGGYDWFHIQLERFYFSGIGFLLLALGLRAPTRPPSLLTPLSSLHILSIQLALIGLLVWINNDLTFWITGVMWLTMLFLAIFRPYGDMYQPFFTPPIWFLAFVASHFVTTLIYAGYRFHWPLDGMLVLVSLVGFTTLGYELLVALVGQRRPIQDT